jgi:hypothetical protein
MTVQLGQTVITATASVQLDAASVVVAIGRHTCGDWGDLDKQDKRSNDQALLHGGRLLSSYVDVNGVKFWIITEADRSVTTVLLPSDY